MYYLLNYIPSIVYIVMFMLPKPITLDAVVYITIYLFIQPLYLLAVNIYFIYQKSISYVVSIICMVSVVIFHILPIMIYNKIKTGYFTGDVPEGVYYLLFFIPFSIIIVGITIAYFIIRKNR